LYPFFIFVLLTQVIAPFLPFPRFFFFSIQALPLCACPSSSDPTRLLPFHLTKLLDLGSESKFVPFCSCPTRFHLPNPPDLPPQITQRRFFCLSPPLLKDTILSCRFLRPIERPPPYSQYIRSSPNSLIGVQIVTLVLSSPCSRTYTPFELIARRYGKPRHLRPCTLPMTIPAFACLVASPCFSFSLRAEFSSKSSSFDPVCH